jgi:hypothetical protein
MAAWGLGHRQAPIGWKVVFWNQAKSLSEIILWRIIWDRPKGVLLAPKHHLEDSRVADAAPIVLATFEIQK